ncbi:diguanylate cyclase [Pigmentiphaga soli]|uniref:diguanylate cyclase n=1 Tax=Pigmentiphaga soli TaxID=1007095 RepID=A0ABP8HS98_9BURK
MPGIAHFLFFGSLSTAALVLIVSAVTLWQTYQYAWERGRRAAENLRQSVTGYMDQHMRLYTAALNFAYGALHSPQTRGLPDEAKRLMLELAAQSNAYVSGVLELDAKGDVIMASSSVPTGLNFADRDYFTVHRDDPHVGVYVSKPFANRVTPGTSIALSRRISRPDGSFAGVVAISIRLAYIESFLSTIDMGPQGALLLLSGDGKILARQPPRDRQGQVGTDISQSDVFRRMQEMGSGAFVGTAVVDGIERYYTFTHVPGQPLIVNVAFATGDMFEAWRERSIVTGGLTLVTCAIIVALSLLLRREFRSRAIIEADLARLSLTDPLTGLANRRRYDDMLRREWRRTARTGSPLALLLLDVDGFKQLNDRHGHARGDEVLRALGRIVAAAAQRVGDLCARYGGEEFAVVLPDTTREGALAVAERIRAACESLDAGLPPFTVSIGVNAVHPTSEMSMAAFQEAADKALYEAKAAGRNRVVVAGGAFQAPAA